MGKWGVWVGLGVAVVWQWMEAGALLVVVAVVMEGLVAGPWP